MKRTFKQDSIANLFVISAPSGAGKTSLIKALLQRMDNIIMSTSHTTRQPRKGEIDGEDYFFVSKTKFEQMIAENAFLEYAKVFDNYYGTSFQAVEEQLQQGSDVILEIDWQGAEKVKKVCQPVSIFILPPSLQALKERLTGRATDSEAVIAKRLASSVADIQHYKQADYVVINDDFEQAISELMAIITATRLKLENLKKSHADILAKLEG